MAMFTACDKETKSPYEAPAVTVEVIATDVIFEPEGGEGTIDFNAAGSVTATSNKDWCSVSVSGYKATVTVGEWVNLEPRYAVVTLKSGAYSVDVTVQQKGFKSVAFPYNSLRIKKEGGSTSFPYEYDKTMSATSSEGWATVEVTESALTITATENATTSPRNASVDWNLGASLGTVDVWQYGQFAENTSWNASYDGEYNYSGTYYSIITIDGPGYYDFFVGNASALASADDVESNILEYIDENLAWAASNGYTPQDLYYDESDSWLYPSINTPGEYKIVLFEVNEDYVPTGKFQTFDAKVVAPPTYEDFLGKWTLESNDGSVETWEITADQTGSSYLISGINGVTVLYNVTLKVPATYSNGTMSVSARRGLGTYTNSSGYEVNFTLCGIYLNSAGTKYRVTPSATGTYALFTATLNEDKDKLTLTPAAYASSPTGAFTGMQYYGVYINDSGSTAAYYYNGNKNTPLPQVADKVGGTGGGGGTVDKYSKWLGSWTIDRQGTTDTWEISQKVKDQSYTITGIEGHGAGYFGSGNETEAVFDAETGNLQLFEQELPNVITNSAEEEVTVCLYARFVYSNGTTYYNGKGDKIFDAAMAEDGKSATLTPGGWTYQGTTYDFVDFLYYGMVEDKVKYWWCDGVTTLIPNTLTSGTASAPQASYGTGFTMTKNAAESATKAGSIRTLGPGNVSTDKNEVYKETTPRFAKVR